MRKPRRKKNGNEKGRIPRIVVIILKAAVLGIILSLICFVIFALILNVSQISETVIPSVIQVIKIASIVVASIYGVRKIKTKGWLIGAIIGVTYIIFSMIINSFFSDGTLSVKIIFSDIILGLIIGAVGGIIGMYNK
ncbi:MAG TPA: TIGR04086 family membrane protein [Clostridiales bacterium]|nr:TIGR04086 family membrane protein [Clostridiales bacterium]